MINLLLEARRGDRSKSIEATKVETGFATVQETNLGNGIYFCINYIHLF